MSKAFTKANRASIETLLQSKSSPGIALQFAKKIASVLLFTLILFITYQSSACTVTGVVTNVSCYGGSNGAINVSVSGGTSPYHWVWNNGSTSEDRTNLSAGTYTATVTDYYNNHGSATFTVTQPSAISVTATVTNVTTNGGSNGAIDVSVSGGSSPYTYLWNGGATTQDRSNLTAGTYTVTVTDNHSCTKQQTYTVTQPSCNAQINSVIIYNLGNGTTFDVIQDNESYTLGSLPSSWNIEALVSGSSAESVQFTFSGSYTSTNIENTTPFRSPTDAVQLNLGVGTYTLVVKVFSADNAGGSMCAQTTLHFSITPNCNLSLSATTTNVSCYGGYNGSIDVSVSGAQGTVTYLWNNGATTQDRSGLAAGTYTVTATDGGCSGCTATLTKTITQPTALSVTAVITNVTTNGGSNGAIDVSVSGGSSPYTYLWNGGATTQDRSNLTAGTYTVTVTDNHNCTKQQTYTVTQPTCNGQINSVIIYNLGNGTTFDVIQDNDTYTLGSLPSSWNIEALVSGTTAESVQFTFSGDYTATNIENTVPFRSPTDAVQLNLGIGSYTLNVKLYSADNAGGSVCAETTLHFTITPTCSITVSITPNGGICSTLPAVLTANASNYSNCSTTYSDCNHTLVNSGGFLDLPSASTICGDNSGTKLWTQSGSGTSFITLDFGVVVPAGTVICANMKLEHCVNSSTGYSNAQISSSLSSNSGFSTIVSSLQFSQMTYQEFCYTLSSSARYIKILDNGNCAFRVDYVKYTTTTNNSNLTYLWTGPGISGDNNQSSVTINAAGTYTVVVTDCQGCSATASFNKPGALQLSATTTNVLCHGGSNGSIDVTVTGGTSPYTYLWNDGITTQDRSGLSAGTYTVTVTDYNGCTATLTKTITQPDVLTVNGTTVDVTITGGNNGSIDVTVTGGIPPYTYLWNDGATTQDRTGLIAGTYTVTVTDYNGCTANKTFIIYQPPCNLALTATTVNVTCHGSANGSIDVSVTGAQGTVTYLWNDGATTQDRTGLAAGTYTVTATDAGNCSYTLTKTITEPDVLGVNGTAVDVTITGGNDGSIDVTVTGGTPPYTYLWNDGATTQDRTGLMAGTYTVTVTDYNGCTANGTFIIHQPPCSFNITQNHTDVSCYGGNDGSILIGVHNNQGTVTYLWNDGVTTQHRFDLAAGTYTVTATDQGGCTATKTIIVEQPSSAVSVSLSKTDVTITNGSDGTATATPSGGTPGYTYLWSTGATTSTISGLTVGTYTVTVTDSHGCTASNYITLNQPGCNISLDATVTNVTCYGNADGAINVTTTGGQGTVTYLWNDGPTTEDRTGLAPGTYTLTATDAGNCSYTLTRTITQPDALGVSGTTIDVSINGGSDGSINVTVTGGTSPYTYLWNDGVTTEDRTGLAAGTYTVVVTDHNGCTGSHSFTLNQPNCVCIAPTTFSIDSISASQANLCWNAVPCATGYRIRWRTQPKLKWSYRVVTASCSIFTNQYPNVYDIQVATLCSTGDSSSYSALFVFYTYPSCFAPGGLYTSNITPTKAALHWNAASDAVSYTIAYRVVGNPTFTTKNSSTTSLNLKGLLPNTTYEWKVLSKCGSGQSIVTGQYSALSTFTTASLRIGEENFADAAFTVYPNPASHNFNVDFDLGMESGDDYVLIISNTLGQVVYSESNKLENGRLSENVLAGEIFTNGLYSVSILVNGHQFNQTMIIIKH